MVKVVTFLKRKPGCRGGLPALLRTRHPESCAATAFGGMSSPHTSSSYRRASRSTTHARCGGWAPTRCGPEKSDNAGVRRRGAVIDRTTMGFLVTEEQVVVEGAASRRGEGRGVPLRKRALRGRVPAALA